MCLATHAWTVCLFRTRSGILPHGHQTLPMSITASIHRRLPHAIFHQVAPCRIASIMGLDRCWLTRTSSYPQTQTCLVAPSSSRSPYAYVCTVVSAPPATGSRHVQYVSPCPACVVLFPIMCSSHAFLPVNLLASVKGTVCTAYTPAPNCVRRWKRRCVRFGWLGRQLRRLLKPCDFATDRIGDVLDHKDRSQVPTSDQSPVRVATNKK